MRLKSIVTVIALILIMFMAAIESSNYFFSVTNN